MASAKQEILDRIRVALGDRPVAEPVVRDYRVAGSVAPDLELFIERLLDYKATVHRCTEEQAATRVAASLQARGVARIVVPAGFPTDLLAEVDVEVVGDDPELGAGELDRLDGVVTTCAVAIADTGTIVLDAGPGQGRRALTLVPDYHLIVVRARQVVALVPDGVAHLDPTRPLTWISGPSATSDIELQRVEGVHGPRTLDVILID
jgi:L-lactate dehydrogenase complex protein LldG